MGSFKEHRDYGLSPTLKLDALCLTAYKGAEYHLSMVKKLHELPCIQTMWKNNDSLDPEIKRQLQTNVGMFHWHVRAFFWELTAVFDTVLNWANQRYSFGLDEHNVIWRNVCDAAPSKHPREWAKKQAVLESAYNSEWFYEVRKYRNFAHRGFLYITSLYDGHFDKSEATLTMVSLAPVREGQRECQDMTKQLSGYLEGMRELGERVFS